MKQNQETKNKMEEVYEKPQVEIIEMEIENPIMQASAPGFFPGGGN